MPWLRMRVLRRVLVLGELGRPIGVGERRQGARDGTPLGDRQAGPGQPRRAADRHHGDHQGRDARRARSAPLPADGPPDLIAMRILNSGGRAIPGAATGLGDARRGGNVGGAAARGSRLRCQCRRRALAVAALSAGAGRAAAGTVMRRRTRTLIGTLAILAFVCVYGPLAMALADSRIAETPRAGSGRALLDPRDRLDLPADAADPLDGTAGSLRPTLDFAALGRHKPAQHPRDRIASWIVRSCASKPFAALVAAARARCRPWRRGRRARSASASGSRTTSPTISASRCSAPRPRTWRAATRPADMAATPAAAMAEPIPQVEEAAEADRARRRYRSPRPAICVLLHRLPARRRR